ncbi:hypothetical protein [Aldersonia kunmingensis]|uniref:hypothetical protein n=1 Tax=Aldersonia kunmingensis TaxID=408066 RepID=UPI0012EE5383|nr:hypothetical protein [Aldersonia kunmingensis]
MRNPWLFDRREQVLTAVWTPARGITDLTADLPDDWLAAVHRLGHDLHVRQYGGHLDHVHWVGEYDEVFGTVLILTNVTPRDRAPNGLGGHTGASLDSDQDTIVSNIADSVQDSVGDAGIAWPWGDVGSILRPCIEDNIAVWYDGRQGRAVAPIGDLNDHVSAY